MAAYQLLKVGVKRAQAITHETPQSNSVLHKTDVRESPQVWSIAASLLWGHPSEWQKSRLLFCVLSRAWAKTVQCVQRHDRTDFQKLV